jgi:hypothetical protein
MTSIAAAKNAFTAASSATTKNGFTAAQIEKGKLDDLGKRIEAHLEKMRGYEAKAQEKAGVELREADDHFNTITQLLAEAKAKCDTGGFNAFRQKYCPDLSRSRIYELLAIGEGKKTLEEIRAEKRARVAKSRSKKVSATPPPVADKSEPKVQPAMSPKEQGTYGGIRDRAHDMGCKLSRSGKRYDLTHDGRTIRYVNLDMVKHMLDIIEGKVLVVVGDECMGNPLSMQKEMNPEAAKAYAAARNDIHEQPPPVAEQPSAPPPPKPKGDGHDVDAAMAANTINRKLMSFHTAFDPQLKAWLETGPTVDGLKMMHNALNIIAEELYRMAGDVRDALSAISVSKKAEADNATPADVAGEEMKVKMAGLQ